MLLALEREDRRGDVAACLFLIASLGFSGLGIPFLAAAAVAIGLGPRESWLRRAYVVVIPAALFAAWYLGWGHDAETHLSIRNMFGPPASSPTRWPSPPGRCSGSAPIRSGA